jgi:WD40 repeat protein
LSPVLAVRHANGQDWWIIEPQLISLGFQRVLLSSKGVQYVGVQNIKAFAAYEGTTKGQVNFSPDGRKLVMGDPYNGILIFDFDRCSGLFSSKYQKIDIGYNKYACTGVEFSPNNRFLYVALRNELWQYDLQAPDLIKSKILIDTYDGFAQPYQTAFFQCQLAPDDKIYIGSTNGNYYMSIIHSPDSLGKACNFKQHDLKLPEYYYVELPNMPNYRLGASDINCALPVSVNDKANATKLDISIFPNPTSGYITITSKELPNTFCTWALFDAQGRYVFSQLLHSEKLSLNLPPHLPKGIYFWRVVDNDRNLQQGKLVVLE